MMQTWHLQDVRTTLRDVVDQAMYGAPQRVTGYGRQSVIVVSEDEWHRLTKGGPVFGDILTDCPLATGDLPKRRPARALRLMSVD
jgi:prevent-host-death family protein